MKFASTGIRARLRSYRADRDRSRRGYLLLEALVALTLLLGFAAVLGPVLFQARAIVREADDRIAAQALLRSLLDSPLDRTALAGDPRAGENGDLRWRISATPLHVDIESAPRAAASSGQEQPKSGQEQPKPAQDQPNWKTYRVVASVSFGQDHTIAAETVRLGQAP